MLPRVFYRIATHQSTLVLNELLGLDRQASKSESFSALCNETTIKLGRRQTESFGANAAHLTNN